jgi:hypothetical protein
MAGVAGPRIPRTAHPASPGSSASPASPTYPPAPKAKPKHNAPTLHLGFTDVSITPGKGFLWLFSFSD